MQGKTPTVNLNLDVSSLKGVNMMVDSGAQISLVGTKVLKPEIKIDSTKRVKITSIHGTEETLGEVGANIMCENLKIPVSLQVMKNSPVPEDGIIGFDVLQPYAIMNGPEKKLTFQSQDRKIDIPINIRYGSNQNDNLHRKLNRGNLNCYMNTSNKLCMPLEKKKDFETTRKKEPELDNVNGLKYKERKSIEDLREDNNNGNMLHYNFDNNNGNNSHDNFDDLYIISKKKIV